MMTRVLLRLGALAAILAGVLRIGASFLGYGDPTPAREIFYLTIDLCILFGVVTVYLYQYEVLGASGLLGFIAALTGAAIIVGPDGSIGEVGMYPLGSALLVLGLAVMAGVGWQAARVPRYASAGWLLSALFGLVSALPGTPSILLALAGLAFGFGFLGAGVRIWFSPSLV